MALIYVKALEVRKELWRGVPTAEEVACKSEFNKLVLVWSSRYSQFVVNAKAKERGLMPKIDAKFAWERKSVI